MNKQNEETAKIKEIVESRLPGAKVVLFGSRARGDFDEKSDYDLLIITKDKKTIGEKIQISETLRDSFSQFLIPTDIIIKSEDEVDYFRDKIGSVVREALKEGLTI